MDKVLIASSSSKGSETFASLILQEFPAEIQRACTEQEALRLLKGETYSIILLHFPLQETPSSELIHRALGTTSGVMLVTKSPADTPQLSAWEKEGVLLFSLSEGKSFFRRSIRLLLSVHRRLQTAPAKEQKLQQKLQDIRLIDRAKCMLIQYSRMTEPEAHRYIEKLAMDRRVTRKDIATEILQGFDLE